MIDRPEDELIRMCSQVQREVIVKTKQLNYLSGKFFLTNN